MKTMKTFEATGKAEGWIDADEEEQALAMQQLINSGAAWGLQGSTGRAAMALIEAGVCLLGHVSHTDYWGNRVPSRDEVKPGSKGSFKYVVERSGYNWAKSISKVGAN